ncbi:MAG: MerR family DNA-binding transcriptional regulator [Caldilineaceae bacterium]|nr:MerR family DNA-binding transcriptional regulator [Caldilineaceae bacterium]
MAVRPIDIARKLDVSAAALRNYEDCGMIPKVARSASGHRVYTEEHFAYFVCIREMLVGFTLTHTVKILREVMARKIDSALWLVNDAQAELHQQRIIFNNISWKLLHRVGTPIDVKLAALTINDVSRETGIPVATIRHWDRVGLLSAHRCGGNSYRMYTAEHIRQALTIYALKLSLCATGEKHCIDNIKEGIQQFDYDDQSKIHEMTKGIEQYLDQTNRDQIKGISALYRLCVQVDTHHFEDQI